MMRTKLIPTAMIAVSALVVTGCLGAPQLNRLAEGFAREFPDANFKKEFSLTIGSFGLCLARLAAGFSDDGREARRYLSGVKRLQLAVFNVRDLPDLEDTELPEPLQDLLRDEGWQMVIKVREPDDRVWILFREQNGNIRGMYFIVLDDEELVIVRVSGRLERFFDQAMDNPHVLLKQIDHTRDRMANSSATD